MAILKKKFFEVEIPLTNSSVELLAYSIDALDKRTVKLDLTRQLRGKSIEAVFQVRVKDKKAVAEPVKLTLLPFFIRRMIRRSISYVEDSFSAECKDAWIRIKPFLITRKRVSRKIRKALNKEAKNWLVDYVKSKTYKDIFSEIIGNRLQKSLSLKLKKIYPLALCEIRVLKVEKLKEIEELKVTLEKIEEKEIEPAMKFNPGLQKYEVDTEETKEKIESIKAEEEIKGSEA